MTNEYEFLNESMNNYVKPGERDGYVFMNKELAKPGDEYQMLLDDELKNGKRNKIVNVTEKANLHNQAKMLAAVTCSIFVIGSAMNIMLNVDVISSTKSLIQSIGNYPQFRESLLTITSENKKLVLTLLGTAITLAGTIHHGVKYNKYSKQLKDSSIGISELEEAKGRN